MNIKKWWQQKTTQVGVAGILTGVALILTGDTANGVLAIEGGFVAIFLRQAVNK